MEKKYFNIIKKSEKSKARLSTLETGHGKINGPFFMPIATRGAVKNLTTDELKNLNTEIILSNTYHLWLRPGVNLMKKYGGLHNFMNWSGPILTDSGGFQVFSLADHRGITDKGISFKDPVNGQKYFLTPELAIKIQNIIGSDISMVLDECVPYPCKKSYAKDSLELTTDWAKRCKKEFLKSTSYQPACRQAGLPAKKLLFGIVQGSVYKDLRLQSAKEIVDIGFDGYAIGGVANGREPQEKRQAVLNWVTPILPEDKPRYLMGVGRPEEIVYAVKQGIDMFDCVIPTREARHGRLYLWNSITYNLKTLPTGKQAKTFYKTINIKNAKYAKDLSPINNTNLKKYSKAYLHHLFKTSEPLGMRLATLNNLKFYLDLMKKLRLNIKQGIF